MWSFFNKWSLIIIMSAHASPHHSFWRFHDKSCIAPRVTLGSQVRLSGTEQTGDWESASHLKRVPVWQGNRELQLSRKHGQCGSWNMQDKTWGPEHLTQPRVPMQAGQGSGSTVSRDTEWNQQYNKPRWSWLWGGWRAAHGRSLENLWICSNIL